MVNHNFPKSFAVHRSVKAEQRGQKAYQSEEIKQHTGGKVETQEVAQVLHAHQRYQFGSLTPDLDALKYIQLPFSQQVGT